MIIHTNLHPDILLIAKWQTEEKKELNIWISDRITFPEYSVWKISKETNQLEYLPSGDSHGMWAFFKMARQYAQEQWLYKPEQLTEDYINQAFNNLLRDLMRQKLAKLNKSQWGLIAKAEPNQLPPLYSKGLIWQHETDPELCYFNPFKDEYLPCDRKNFGLGYIMNLSEIEIDTNF